MWGSTRSCCLSHDSFAYCYRSGCRRNRARTCIGLRAMPAGSSTPPKKSRQRTEKGKPPPLRARERLQSSPQVVQGGTLLAVKELGRSCASSARNPCRTNKHILMGGFAESLPKPGLRTGYRKGARSMPRVIGTWLLLKACLLGSMSPWRQFRLS